MYPKVIIITGPTAAGKTYHTHKYLELLNSKYYSLINADSRLFYQELNIGSAKPIDNEIKKYHYQLINFLKPKDKTTANDFINNVNQIILTHPKRPIFIVGGSTFYLDVLINGLPQHLPIDTNIKKELIKQYQSQGLVNLLIELKNKDFDFYQEVDKNNPRRVLRALEVIRSGYIFSKLRKKRKKNNYQILMITIIPPRQILYERITTRVKAMFEAGWIEEVKSLLNHYSATQLSNPKIIGYNEIIEYITNCRQKLINQISLDSIKEKIIHQTKQLAKRQLTWLKKNRIGPILFTGYNSLDEINNNKISKLDQWIIEDQRTIITDDNIDNKISKLINTFLNGEVNSRFNCSNNGRRKR